MWNLLFIHEPLTLRYCPSRDFNVSVTECCFRVKLREILIHTSYDWADLTLREISLQDGESHDGDGSIAEGV